MPKTDKELFREYLMSKEAGNGTDTPGTLYLTGYAYHELDGLLRDIANSVIMGGVLPDEAIDEAIDTFRNVIADLERVKKGFSTYKAAMEAA
jgi:hypothetical protein